MPQTSVTCVLQCAGNGRSRHRPIVPGLQWSQGAIGNARWTGVRVRHLLLKAGLRATARHLHTKGSDTPPGKVPPFHRSLEIEKALEDAIVALSMNGEPLPSLHGAPARLVVPGWAGDHWMKWLTSLSARTEPERGFFMDVAYRFPKTPGEPGVPMKPEEMAPVTRLFVKSNITQCPKEARLGETVSVRGFAFSGCPDIANVELSDDDGKTFTKAELDPRHDPFAWRLFRFRYRAKTAGKVTLFARATDMDGNVQPREAVWNQSGYLYNSWHSAELMVRSDGP